MRVPRIPPEFHYCSMSDGYRVCGRVWRPRRTQSGFAFIYLHGIQSHGAWFEWSAALLAETGNLVLLPDRRGSGLNETARGDTPSAERWLLDIDEWAGWAEREFGVERFGLVGVSWGGKLASVWAQRHPQRVARLLLIAPGLFPAVDLSPLAKLGVGLSLLGGGRRLLAIPLNDPALFTDNPAGQRFIADDRHKLERVTARFWWHSRRLDSVLSRLQEKGLRVPVSVVLAGRERIIQNAPTEAWVRRVAAQPPSIKRFNGAAHTLEFEPDTADFARLLEEWAEAPEPGA